MSLLLLFGKPMQREIPTGDRTFQGLKPELYTLKAGHSLKEIQVFLKKDFTVSLFLVSVHLLHT